MCTIKTILTTVHFDIKKFSPRTIIQTKEKTNIQLFKHFNKLNHFMLAYNQFVQHMQNF